MRQYTDKQHFDENDISEHDDVFWIAEGDDLGHIECIFHLEMIEHNFHYRVQTNNENRFFLETEIDKEDRKSSEKEAGDEYGFFRRRALIMMQDTLRKMNGVSPHP
eukprot:CAMPEP_0194447414 /NCGR_PEP_ID=MMETSP0176-20130528/128999_1 /TAXON_ID=216777 /ORGANISM="Proboscia alata, Strain PI-D3" /LENGTH=105 /DNA_ID=CAMNT_0039274271 /DNA_START=813 /DNA_END=1126 /DNA_ORIENTATION=+